MGREGITYEQVVEVAIKLSNESEKPTIRRVRSELGDTGSMGTIQSFLARWREENQTHVLANSEIAPEIQIALSSAINANIKKVTLNLESAISIANEEISVFRDENFVIEEKLDNERKKNKKLIQEHDKLSGKLEKSIEDYSALVLEKEKERKDSERSRTELAKIQVKMDSFKEKVDELRQQNEMLLNKFEVSQVEAINNDKRATLAEAKIESKDQQIMYLEKQLNK